MDDPRLNGREKGSLYNLLKKEARRFFSFFSSVHLATVYRILGLSLSVPPLMTPFKEFYSACVGVCT